MPVSRVRRSRCEATRRALHSASRGGGRGPRQCRQIDFCCGIWLTERPWSVTLSLGLGSASMLHPSEDSSRAGILSYLCRSDSHRHVSPPEARASRLLVLPRHYDPVDQKSTSSTPSQSGSLPMSGGGRRMLRSAASAAARSACARAAWGLLRKPGDSPGSLVTHARRSASNRRAEICGTARPSAARQSRASRHLPPPVSSGLQRY
jgi:hypothetical protein